MHELSASTNRFGDYILHDRIGAGGMAEIFLATATGIEGFEKRVVIKRILPSLSDDEQFVRMFIEEAKLCVALRHPNIVQVHDLGEIDSQYYIAMEYVDGRDLLKTLAACGKKKIGFPTDIALFIVMEVLKGLHYAHQLKKPNGDPLGIIHRDVSPSNVLLSFEGEVKIGDFGIAKASTREKTATGILKGKFGYMAPEQVTGVPIDSRADIFAVGIVMYELLTGHRLFAGKNDLAVLEKVRDARIEPAPRHYRQDLDDELEHLVLRALAREAKDRFQTAQELHDAIHDYVYRSRATVGPAHLARFMQTLFLNDPDEIDRRTRVRLPQPRAFPVGGPIPANGTPTNGTNGTNGATNGHSLELLQDADFDEKTPLLDPDELPGARPLSSVAFISDVDSWERAGSSALIEYALADAEVSKTSGRPKPPPVPPPTYARLEQSRLDSTATESTARTDVEELEVAPPPVAVDDSKQSPLARIAALRAAAEQDAPTDLDLSEDSKRMVAEAEGEKKSLPRAMSTVYGRGPTPQRKKGLAPSEDEEDTTQKRSDDEDDYHDPSDIVERTVSTSEQVDLDDEEELTAEVEPTVRFDSSNQFRGKSGLADPTVTTATGQFERARSDDDAEETSREPDGYENPAEDTGGGTLQLEEGDLPTAEVPEEELRADGIIRSETDTVPAPPRSKPDTAIAPEDPEVSRTDVQLDLPDALVSPILDDEDLNDRTESDLDPSSTTLPPEEPSIFDDATKAEEEIVAAELEAVSRQASVSSAQRAVAEIRRARRASRMANELAKEEARSPSRRRPITSRRPRPLLLPAEEEGEPKLTPNPRATTNQRARRRQTATRSISVVNPLPRQPSLRRQPIVQAKPREESFNDTTGAGMLVNEETASGEMAAPIVEPNVAEVPKRRRSSGVSAALSEAARADSEIAEIRKKSVSRGAPPDDATTPDALADQRTEEYDPEFDEEDTKQGVKVKEAVARIQSRKRIATQSFVLYGDKQEQSFGDDDSETSAPIITSAGRLEDEGASDLFGVLKVLDNGTLDEANFGGSDEEVSLETDARDYGTGETRLGLLAGQEEETEGDAFGEESTASVTSSDVLSISKLIQNSAVPLEPDVVEMGGEDSGISISFEPKDREDSTVDPLEKSGFDFEFTDNEEPTEEQKDPESRILSAVARRKSVLEMPAGIPRFEETSNQRPARLISDSFDLEKRPEPKIASRSDQKTKSPPPVRPVSMIDASDETGEGNLDLPAPARAKPSKEAALRRVVERHKVAKEVRAKGTPPAAMPSPAAGSTELPLGAAARAMPTPVAARPSRAAPSAGQFYPPVQTVDVRSSTALNKFATFAVLIAVLLAVAAAVSILLQNRPRAIPPIADRTEIKTELSGAASAPPVEPPPPALPPPEEPPPVEEPPPPEPPVEAQKLAEQKLAEQKLAEQKLAEQKLAEQKLVAQKQVAQKQVVPPPARPEAPRGTSEPPKKKRKISRAKGDTGVLRISCDDPIDIKISTIGTVKSKKKYGRQLKPGDYRVTLINGSQRKSYDVILVPGDPVVIRCPF